MPIPPFVAELRALVGTHPLWLPGVTAVVMRGAGAEREVLLTLRADNGAWAPITGIVDPDEEPGVTAAREAREEAGVEVSVDRLAAVSVISGVVYPNGDRSSFVDLTFACTWLAGEARVGDDENFDVRWWPADALPALQDSARERIEAALSDEVAARFVS